LVGKRCRRGVIVRGLRFAQQTESHKSELTMQIKNKKAKAMERKRELLQCGMNKEGRGPTSILLLMRMTAERKSKRRNNCAKEWGGAGGR